MASVGVFVFHNDLRLHDNIGLITALGDCDSVVPVFIFTPEQIGSGNSYRSIPAIEFMLAQLDVLDAELRKHGSRLYMFYGETTAVLARIIAAVGATAVYSNANYTPYALDRDTRVGQLCDRKNCAFGLAEDYGLYEIGRITRTKSDPVKGIYKKFTPYYTAASKVKPAKPLQNRASNYYSVSDSKGSHAGNIAGVIGTATIRRKLKAKKIEISSAQTALNSIKSFRSYNRDRNILAHDTTHLSAFIKFGVVSVRDVYWTIKSDLGAGSSDLIKQLYWREFYMNLVWAYPYVLEGRNFNQNYHANWRTSGDKAGLNAWCNGKTGYPIVDACMSQLNNSGWMHNRGRLIVAGFLTKVMGWHWKFGERYFAVRLVDYDPAQNNGNWQFVAGSGVDSQPYFRMFNPWLQSAKHDPDGLYIKKWCPYYKDFPANVLHDEDKLIAFITENNLRKIPKPIISYERARDDTRKRYKAKK